MGEFYEACGIDAVLLVQHAGELLLKRGQQAGRQPCSCSLPITASPAVLPSLRSPAGLNPMGAGNPPRAGCPRQNLRRTVADLVQAGLSVAVCEEVRWRCCRRCCACLPCALRMPCI